MASRKEFITCSNLAKKIDIKHSCNRKYFLNKKNKCRHKLKPYSLLIPAEEEYLHKVLSLNTSIGRSSRTPMTTRIERVFGHSVQCFEICDNLRHQINKKIAEINRNDPPQLEPVARQQQVEEEQTTTITPGAGFVTESVNNPGSESSTIATNTTETVASILRTVAEEGLNNQPNATSGTNNYNDESLYVEEEQMDSSTSQQPISRRSPNSLLIEMINNIDMIQPRKKPSELKSTTSMRKRADEGLAYLIRLCSYRNITSLVHKKEIMEELFLLINEIKARALAAFRLTPSEIEIPATDGHSEELADTDENSNGAQMELFFNQNLSNLKYKEARQMLNHATDGKIKLRPTKDIYQESRDLVNSYQIKNTEYGRSPVTESGTSRSLSTNLEKDADNKIVFKDCSKVPEFLFGANLPLDKAMNLILNSLGKVVAQIPNAMLDNALKTSLMIGCADAAEMDSLSKVNKHVTSFSLVPTSNFLVERCGLYTSSIKNIIPINQLNSKELLDHLKYVLNERFDRWLSVKEGTNYDIEFVDMHDAKFTYTVLQCSAWSRLHKPFCSCDCRRGAGALPDHICSMFSNEKYRELYDRSKQQMQSAAILAAARRSGQYTNQDHRNWVDEHNSGVSHLGLPPETWTILSLAFDVFHGRVNYVKLQVDYCRKMLEGDYESLDSFATFMISTLKSWRNFQISSWLNNDGISRLKGEHTKDFTRSTHKLCQKLKTLVNSQVCNDFCEALYAYEKVHCFMSFVIIDDYETANAFLGRNEFSAQSEKQAIGEKMIETYNCLAKQLYSYGMKTFLSDRVHGDRETFYAHAVRFYFPQILKKTYRKYGLGLGIFTMEGFEAINYFTKRMIRDHTNRKGNICAQTMVRIVFAYQNHNHDVASELKKRQKARPKLLETIKRIHHFLE